MIQSNALPYLLQAKDLSYSYHTLSGEIPALSNISFSLNSGDFLAIIGPSGCGKSTLLNIIAGLLEPDSGTLITENDKPLKIGYMLQHDHLLNWKTIEKNVALGPIIQKKYTKEIEDKLDSLLSKYGLYEFKYKKPSELSGGMRQRAALIRTLALDPDLLLLDEPFSALDYQTRLSVSADISKIIKENHKTAILVTHNLSEAISMANKIMVLSPRPATIKRCIPIHLTVEDSSPLGYRNAKEFNDYFNLLWEDLCNE